MSRIGFTLIELLVVIAIIVVLSTLVLVGAQWARLAALTASTVQRMEEVSRAFTLLSGEQGSAVSTLWERGALTAWGSRFKVAPTAPSALTRNFSQTRVAKTVTNVPITGLVPVGAAQSGAGAVNLNWHMVAPNSACDNANQPLVFAFPWGQVRHFAILEAWYTDARTFSHPIPGWADRQWPAMPLGFEASATGLISIQRSFLPQDLVTWRLPEPHALSELRTYPTLELLKAVGILPDITAATVLAQPSRRNPWNDAWGNPLTVGIALYQPPAAAPLEAWPGGTTVMSQVQPERYLRLANERYGYPHAMYLSIGAVGPRPKVVATAGNLSTTYFQDAWKQVNEVCNQKPGSSPATDLWYVDATFNAFTTPPWKGAKIGKAANGQRCILTAPVEIR